MEKENKPTFTIAYKKSITGEGFIGVVEEVPGAASQGKTIEELTDNLKDAVKAIFEVNKLEAREKASSFFDTQDIKEASFCM